MKKKIYFIEVDDVIRINEKAIEQFGGCLGLRDRALLDSAVQYVKTLYGYSEEIDFFHLAAAYCYRIIKNHPFADGNKRAAALTLMVFLEKNNIEISINENNFYRLLLDVAASKKSEEDIILFLKNTSH